MNYAHSYCSNHSSCCLVWQNAQNASFHQKNIAKNKIFNRFLRIFCRPLRSDFANAHTVRAASPKTQGPDCPTDVARETTSAACQLSAETALLIRSVHTNVVAAGQRLMDDHVRIRSLFFAPLRAERLSGSSFWRYSCRPAMLSAVLPINGHLLVADLQQRLRSSGLRSNGRESEKCHKFNAGKVPFHFSFLWNLPLSFNVFNHVPAYANPEENNHFLTFVCDFSRWLKRSHAFNLRVTKF